MYTLDYDIDGISAYHIMQWQATNNRSNSKNKVGGSLGAPKSGSLRAPKSGSFRAPKSGSLGAPKSDIRDT